MQVLEIVALTLPWAIAVFLGWVVTSLVRQHGQALVRHDELRERLAALEGTVASLRPQLEAMAAAPPTQQRSGVAQQPAGLAIGSVAPEFSLPDLEGRVRDLRSFLGKPLLLVFFDVGCGFCRKMAPRLGRLPAEPRVLVVSRGDAEQHRVLASEHGWTCDVVVESGWEVASAYGTRATPTGYLLDAEGRIASALAVGEEAVAGLLGSAGPEIRSAGLRVRDVSESRIKRDGLEPETPAPGFELDDLDGRRRALEDFRGKRVVLVFSDPACGPCEELAPHLVDLHRRGLTDNLEVVMVSRGGVDENRAKAAEHGYEFPVLLQRSWEISKSYAMFATPIAYLIDEAGVIVDGVAVGAPAIRELVSKSGAAEVPRAESA